MPELGSVSQWIQGLRNGDRSVACHIWNRYQRRMLVVAHSELGASSRTVSDEEDVAVTAFAAFLRRMEQGAYSSLESRDDLWRLLVKITRTYAWQQITFLGRLRRSVVRSRLLSDNQILQQLACDSPPPDLAVACSETLRVLLEKLEEPELREIAVGRLNGLTNDEIAAKQNRSVRTIERRLDRIRGVWNRQIDAD